MNNRKITTYLGFALKSGKCSKGSELVLNEIRKKSADVVLISSDASDNTIKSIQNASKTYNILCDICDKDIFDKLLKDNIKVISIAKCELSNQIKKIILSGEN